MRTCIATMCIRNGQRACLNGISPRKRCERRASRIINIYRHAGFDAIDITEKDAPIHWEYRRIRDYLTLYEGLTEWDDSDFWNYCRAMPMPDTLQRKLDLFRRDWHIFRNGQERFSEPSWRKVMVGQRTVPHPW